MHVNYECIVGIMVLPSLEPIYEQPSEALSYFGDGQSRKLTSPCSISISREQRSKY